MKTLLFLDSDTCLTFATHTAALRYANKEDIQSFITLTKYDNGTVKVFNPMVAVESCIEWLPNEADALKYVGSFLS